MSRERIIIIGVCDDCPHCEFYNGWNDRDDVIVCQELDMVISDDIDVGTEIYKQCPLTIK